MSLKVSPNLFPPKVWNIITGRIEKDFLCHQGAVLSCAVSSDAVKFSSTSADKTAKVGQPLERLHRELAVLLVYYVWVQWRRQESDRFCSCICTICILKNLFIYYFVCACGRERERRSLHESQCMCVGRRTAVGVGPFLPPCWGRVSHFFCCFCCVLCTLEPGAFRVSRSFHLPPCHRNAEPTDAGRCIQPFPWSWVIGLVRPVPWLSHLLMTSVSYLGHAVLGIALPVISLDLHVISCCSNSSYIEAKAKGLHGLKDPGHSFGRMPISIHLALDRSFNSSDSPLWRVKIKKKTINFSNS